MMVDPQTWSWVISAVAQVYGVLLGLFAIMITFGIDLVLKVTREASNTEGTRKAFKAFWDISKIVFVPVGGFLIISILMLALGSSVNYNSYLFWGLVVLPFIVVVLALSCLLLKFIEAITMGLAEGEKPKTH
jgi:uncharacterized membrane protein